MATKKPSPVLVDFDESEVFEESQKFSVFHDDVNNDDNEPALTPDDLLMTELTDEEMDGIANDVLLGDSSAGRPKKRHLLQKFRRDEGAAAAMAKKVTLLSGHQTDYPWSVKKDRVDENRQREKLVVAEKSRKENEAFEKEGGVWPDGHADEERPIREIKPCSSHVRAIADFLGADPTSLMVPRHMLDYRGPRLFKLLRKCKAAPIMTGAAAVIEGEKAEPVRVPMVIPAKRWNYEAVLRQPGNLAVFKDLKTGRYFRRLTAYPYRVGTPDSLRISLDKLSELFKDSWEAAAVGVVRHSDVMARALPMMEPILRKRFSSAHQGLDVFRRPGSEFAVSPTGIYSKSNFKDSIRVVHEMVDDFKESAENSATVVVNDKLIATKCPITEASLIKKETGTYRSWRIAPTLWGMSIRGARLCIDAAAVIAGVTPGKAQGVPDVVYKVADDHLKTLGVALNAIVKNSERAQKRIENENAQVEAKTLSPRRRTPFGALALEAVEDLGHYEDPEEIEPTWWDEQEGYKKPEAYWVYSDEAKELGKLVIGGAEAFATIAIAASNPRWAQLGRKLIELRDRFHFGYDEDKVAETQKNLRQLAVGFRKFL